MRQDAMTLRVRLSALGYLSDALDEQARAIGEGGREPMPEVFRSCPKCGAEGIEPTWHKSCSEKDKIGKRFFANTSNQEHLHYFCKCGYDFTREIVRKENLYE